MPLSASTLENTPQTPAEPSSEVAVDPQHRHALEMLRLRGNPFRQQFARNSDDAVCSLYHVDGVFAEQRDLMQEFVESYRGEPTRPTAVLPLLGSRGAGKTHLLHCLKHGPGVSHQLFVTPGTFRIDASGRDSSFLEYLLYQFINVLLAGDEQRGLRPLVYVGEQLVRRLARDVIVTAGPAARLSLLTPGATEKLGWRMGLGVKTSAARLDVFADALGTAPGRLRDLTAVHGINAAVLAEAVRARIDAAETRDLRGDYRRHLFNGFVGAVLEGDELPLADFLTDGFADTAYIARPTRTQLVLSMLEVLTDLIVGSGIPVVVAFDQLEELLYGQTEDEIRRSSDAFFGGLVQLMSQVPGLGVILFAEEGLWNRIVPSLPSHILDRLHEPVFLPTHGTVREVRLSTPTADQLAAVVDCRIRHTLSDMDDADVLPAGFPFSRAELEHWSRRESVLRLMLQGCCTRLDELVADPESLGRAPAMTSADVPPDAAAANAVAETGRDESHAAAAPGAGAGAEGPAESWRHEVRQAGRRLKPVGSLSGATAELHGGLVRWLQFVQSATDTLAAVDAHVEVGEHPTYGVLTVATLADGTRVGIGLWLGRGVGKPRDLETKLEAFAQSPPACDRLVLVRPGDDCRVSGKTKAAWDAAVDAGHAVSLHEAEPDLFAKLDAFPRWLQGQADASADGSVPASADAFVATEMAEALALLGG